MHNLQIYVYVCIHAYMHTAILFPYTYLNLVNRLFISACMNLFHICMHMYMYVYIWIRLHLHVYMYMPMSVYVHSTSLYVYVYVCMYVCMYVCTHAYIHTHIHVRTLSHTRIQRPIMLATCDLTTTCQSENGMCQGVHAGTYVESALTAFDCLQLAQPTQQAIHTHTHIYICKRNLSVLCD